MEFLLLLADDLDDALGAMRHLWPQVIDFVMALLLFAMTGFGLIMAMQTTLTGVAALLAVSLLEVFRQRRMRRSSAADLDDKPQGA